MDISKKIKFLSICVFLVFPLIPNSYAGDDIFIGLGVGNDGINAIRLSKEIDNGKFYVTDLARVSEIGMNFWNKNKSSSSSESSNISVTYSNILIKKFDNNFQISSGLGIAILSDNKIGERNLGTSLQFESRFGVGYETSNTSSTLNLFHYSNAGTATSNSGINVLMFNVSHLF